MLELLERVEVPRVDDDRLLADRVGADAKREPDVRVVEVVRRADAHVVHALGFRAAPQLLEVPIEALDLGEEPDVERIAIEHADRIVRIGGGHEPVAGVLDRLQMPRRDEAGDAGDREILHARCPRCAAFGASRPRAAAAANRGACTCSE